MKPRVHNVLSYSVTLLVFWVVLGFRTRGAEPSVTAQVATVLWSVHFLRRTFESAFVHRYGKPSVGPGDYLTEYVYYWGFAAWIAWSVTAPTEHAPPFALQMVGLAVFCLAEAGNARAHVMLRMLRAPGTTEKRIPRGFLFEWVSCPHYACEIATWIGFNLVTGTLAGCAFMLVGAGILAAWAHARHAAYRKEFDGREGRALYPESRRALLPFVF